MLSFLLVLLLDLYQIISVAFLRLKATNSSAKSDELRIIENLDKDEFLYHLEWKGSIPHPHPHPHTIKKKNTDFKQMK